MAIKRAPTETSTLRLSERVHGHEGQDGFVGHLRCVSMADLVQLECLSGARTAVRVQAGEESGHLFFDGGALVHAETGGLLGIDAAFAILAWNQGTFAQSSAPWPSQPSIDVPWQQLLMISAQRRDEELHHGRPPTSHSASRLLAVAGSSRAEGSRVPPPPPRRVQIPPRRSEESTARAVGETTPPSALDAVSAAVRVSGNGQVLGLRGEGQHLVELAAYIRRLAALIGEDLGMGEFSTLECRLATSQLLVIADTPDSTVVLEAGLEQDIQALGRLLLEPV